MNKRLSFLIVIVSICLAAIQINTTFSAFEVSTVAKHSTFSAADTIPEKTCTDEPEVTLQKIDEKIITFSLHCLDEKYTSAKYTLSYESEPAPQGISGSVDLVGKKAFTSERILLGTCSADGCVSPQNIKNIQVKIELRNNDTVKMHIEKTIQ